MGTTSEFTLNSDPLRPTSLQCMGTLTAADAVSPQRQRGVQS